MKTNGWIASIFGGFEVREQVSLEAADVYPD
jgi:hypothetical protein